MNGTSAKKIWETHEQILDEECRESLAFENETLPFPVEEGVSISVRINNYMKLLADLTNVDVVIDDEDKVLILLSSLSDVGYETFVLTLINGIIT